MKPLVRIAIATCAALPAFRDRTAAGRTRVRDTFVITGGLIAGIGQAAAAAGDAALRAQTRTMARETLRVFGLGT